MTKPNTSTLALIVDESTSMVPVADATVAGINAFPR